MGVSRVISLRLYNALLDYIGGLHNCDDIVEEAGELRILNCCRFESNRYTGMLQAVLADVVGSALKCGRQVILPHSFRFICCRSKLHGLSFWQDRYINCLRINEWMNKYGQSALSSPVVSLCTVTPGLTFNNSTFCRQSEFMCLCVDLRTNSDYFPIQH